MNKTKKILAMIFVVVLSISMIPVTNVRAAKKVKLNKTKATIYVGKTVTLKLKNNKKKVKWTTSNKKIATVSKKGKVKGKKAGKVTITAKVGKKKYNCNITVKKTKYKVYKTQEGKVNKVSCPEFTFKYPKSWKIKETQLNQSPFTERIVLTNSRGVTVTYMSFDNIYGLGNSGRFMNQVKVSKVTNANFVPTTPNGSSINYSNLGKFMVAKLKTIGSLYMDTDSDFTKVDGGVSYALLPQSYTGVHEVVGISGFYSEFAFKYAGLYAFIAEAPKGKFTKKETTEVINILKSVRD